MRRLATAACVFACGLTVLDARQTTPPPAQQQQPPVFRGEVNVIRLDVSVLDKQRRPVRGLTLEDFTITEDGKPQRLVALSEIDVAEMDPAPSAWMRHVAPDITTNDLNDQVGDGRVFAIVMDDVNVPWDDMDIIFSARNVGKYVVEGLGPSDIAAVVYPRDAGLTTEFTNDRSKLIAAIERFDPREPDFFLIPRSQMPGQGGADMPMRSSSVLMRNDCDRRQPTIPALNTVALRLATVPNRRKTIILVSTGVPLPINPAARDCVGWLSNEMLDTFRIAQRANINIHSVDPAGYQGYELYLQKPVRRGGRPGAVASQATAASAARVRRDFLEITADYTGATAVVGSQPVEAGIDRIFEEDGSYYLLGYQSANGSPDGKFRRVSVKVKRPGLTVRTRSGYFAPKAGQLQTPEEKALPSSNDLGLTGMMNPAGVPLRTSVVATGLATAGGRDANVAVVLTARLPGSAGAVTDTLTLTRHVYDADGRASAPVQRKLTITLPPTMEDSVRYDAFDRLVLPPGRYQVRLNARSSVLDRAGSVYADVEVPDFSRSPVTISGIALGAVPSPTDARTDPLAELLPIVPMSGREFSPSDAVVAFCRIFQGGETIVRPVSLKIMILDAKSQVVLDTTETVAPTAFGANRSAPYQLALPLSRMKHGPHVLSIHATLVSGENVRRDVVFRVR
jgi:VWFA-related protein